MYTAMHSNSESFLLECNSQNNDHEPIDTWLIQYPDIHWRIPDTEMLRNAQKWACQQYGTIEI